MSRCSLAERSRAPSSLSSAAALVALSSLLAIASAAARRPDRETALIGYSEQSGGASDFYKSTKPEDCVDVGEFCEDWTGNGECDSNPAYMSKSCRRSCGMCSGPTDSLPEAADCQECQLVELQTVYGSISIKLREDWSPRTAQAVRELAGSQSQGKACRGCQFYRSEQLPDPGAVDNYGGPGPPYAFLQGRLKGLPKQHRERAPLVERGMVCLIGDGPDFFIAVGPHHEWGNGHTVWGEVEDMSTVDFIVNTLGVKHEVWGQTHVTTLVEPIDIQIAVA